MEIPTLDQMVERLNRLTPEAQRQWGKMNLPQMLLHCRLPLESALNQKTFKRVDNVLTRLLIRPMVLKMPWPRGKAQTHPEFRTVELDMPVRSVGEEKAALAAALKAYMAGGFEPPPHPIFGPMTMEQWNLLQRRHMDHHFRQFGG